jgi:hypothetical protein
MSVRGHFATVKNEGGTEEKYVYVIMHRKEEQTDWKIDCVSQESLT